MYVKVERQSSSEIGKVCHGGELDEEMALWCYFLELGEEGGDVGGALLDEEYPTCGARSAVRI